MRVVSLFLSIAATAWGQSAPLADDWRWADPKAALFVSLRMEHLVAYAGLAMEAMQSQAPAGLRGLDPKAMGSLLSGIDTVRIALTPYAGKDKMDGVILVHCTAEAPVLQMPGAYRLGPNEILIGEPGPLRAAVARLSGPPRPMAMPPGAHLWVAGYPNLFPDMAKQDPLLAQVRSISLSMSAARELTMNGAIEATSIAYATQMLARFRAMEGQAPPSVKAAIRMEQSGPVIRFSAILNESQWKSAMATRSHAPAAAVPAPPQPEPARPGKVRILGLEPEPVEVPLKP